MRRLLAVTAALSVSWLLPASIASGTCGGGGGGEGASMNISPSSQTWTGGLKDFQFYIKNTGSSGWLLAGLVTTYESGFKIEDTIPCKGQWLFPGEKCPIEVWGKAAYPSSYLEAWATVGGKEVANDQSFLNP